MGRLDELMREFAKRQRIEAPVGDAEEGYWLTFDGTLRLRCFDRFDNLHLVSPLGRAPDDPESRQALLRRLLNYALVRMRDSPTTPMLDADGEIALFSRIDGVRAMQLIAFEAAVENHVNCLESFQRLMNPLAAPKVEAAAPPRAVFRP